MQRISLMLLMFCFCPAEIYGQDNPKQPLWDRVTHGFADNEGVKIHYVTVGEGPLVVMLHGFPDFWYTWREQIEALENDFQVVAVDLRGYNQSDQPEEVEAYQMRHLINDVRAVIRQQDKGKAIVVGHDWGGAIAWQLAIHHPESVDRLIVCNMTHPTCYEAASMEALKANGNKSYMDSFRQQSADSLTVSWLSGWVKDMEAKPRYQEAFQRSSIKGMLNYYRANSKTREQRRDWIERGKLTEYSKLEMPVLAIFGTQDQYVDKQGLNNTWDWMQRDFTLVTIPDAGHFVQQDAPELVSRSMRMWLLRDR